MSLYAAPFFVWAAHKNLEVLDLSDQNVQIDLEILK